MAFLPVFISLRFLSPMGRFVEGNAMEGVVSAAQRGVVPTIHVVSDSTGVTAQGVVRAATAQFGVTDPKIRLLSGVKDFEAIRSFLDGRRAQYLERYGTDQILVFYTLVNPILRAQFEQYLTEHPTIIAVDLVTNAICAIERASGLTPLHEPGSLRAPDENYYRRIDAVEFTIAHDDGRNPQDLTRADIVLVGVSRTSKTPLSIYLSQQGYKVANIPLDPSTEPPREVFQVDRTRLFGLMTSPEVLIGIRKRRIGTAAHIAPRYADPEYVYEDLEKSRALMRKLGCIVVHTENRAVEETAQEILRYYERSHPHFSDDIS